MPTLLLWSQLTLLLDYLIPVYKDFFRDGRDTTHLLREYIVWEDIVLLPTTKQKIYLDWNGKN